MKKPILSFYILLFSCLMLWLTFPVTDADLGWHLRYGQLYVEKGTVLLKNPFSWIMPQYVWPNHSWGYDLIANLLFSRGSFLLLSLFGGALVSLSPLLLTPFSSYPLLSLLGMVVYLFFTVQLFNVGTKSNQMSLLFTALLFLLLFKSPTNSTRRYLIVIPLIFLLWANLHGQFIVGLAFLWFWSFLQLIHKSSSNIPPKNWLLIASASTLATLVNPFGISLYTTALSHFNAPTLQYIYEWLPWDMTLTRQFALIISIVIIWFPLLPQLKRHFTHYMFTVAVVILALKARRLLPIYLLWTLAIAPAYWHTLLKRRKRYQRLNHLNTLLAVTLIEIVIGICFITPKRHLNNQSWDSYCHSSILCSEPLISYLKTHHIQGKLFNAYRLGGHLIYRYPSNKVAIDGRMTVWRDQQGNYPFLTYYQVIHAGPTAMTWLVSNQIDYVILEPGYELSSLLAQNHWPLLFDDGVVRLYQNPYLTPTL